MYWRRSSRAAGPGFHMARLPCRTVGALVAPGATGKSFWALEAAMSIACSVAGGDLSCPRINAGACYLSRGRSTACACAAHSRHRPASWAHSPAKRLRRTSRLSRSWASA